MIKPIETQYKGYRFRSRLEARWAVLLDSLEYVWEYEKEGYHFDGDSYLPDFYLSRHDCFIEIKGQQKLEEADASKLRRFVKEINRPLLVLCGLVPLYASYAFYPLRENGELDGICIECVQKHKTPAEMVCHFVSFIAASKYLNKEPITPCKCGTADCLVATPEDCFIQAISNRIGPTVDEARRWGIAIKRALSARFEHGEKPEQAYRRRQ